MQTALRRSRHDTIRKHDFWDLASFYRQNRFDIGSLIAINNRYRLQCYREIPGDDGCLVKWNFWKFNPLYFFRFVIATNNSSFKRQSRGQSSFGVSQFVILCYRIYYRKHICHERDTNQRDDRLIRTTYHYDRVRVYQIRGECSVTKEQTFVRRKTLVNCVHRSKRRTFFSPVFRSGLKADASPKCLTSFPCMARELRRATSSFDSFVGTASRMLCVVATP